MFDILFFFLKSFVTYFFVGVIIRAILAIITKTDVSIKGLINTGILFGILYIILILYIVIRY